MDGLCIGIAIVVMGWRICDLLKNITVNHYYHKDKEDE